VMDRRTFITTAAIAASTLPRRSAAVSEETNSGDLKVSGYDYQLPKLKQGCRLLFQGDSITDMKWGRNQSDRNHYLGHSYVYLIAARLGVDMPTTHLDFFNRGQSGNTVAQLRERWQADAVDINPDVLSVLIGINDVGQTIRAGKDHVLLEEWERNYRFILDASRKTNPALTIVLLDPFVLPSKRFGNGEYLKWRAEVEKLCAVVARIAKDYSATHVETQQVFDNAAQVAPPEHWIWDGVHPLPQGHELIARNWLQQYRAMP
jgi:lysophospholipase L1-like esterase